MSSPSGKISDIQTSGLALGLNNTSNSTSRDLFAVTVDGAKLGMESSKFDTAIHAASASLTLEYTAGITFTTDSTWTTSTVFVIVTGGRHSPAEALSNLRVYDCNLQPVSVTQVGDIPPQSRWGHSLTALGKTSFFLFGGRNETQLFGDGYLMRFCLQEVGGGGVNLITGTLCFCYWCLCCLHFYSFLSSHI
jgi:hypothetical protein